MQNVPVLGKSGVGSQGVTSKKADKIKYFCYMDSEDDKEWAKIINSVSRIKSGMTRLRRVVGFAASLRSDFMNPTYNSTIP